MPIQEVGWSMRYISFNPHENRTWKSWNQWDWVHQFNQSGVESSLCNKRKIERSMLILTKLQLFIRNKCVNGSIFKRIDWSIINLWCRNISYIIYYRSKSIENKRHKFQIYHTSRYQCHRNRFPINLTQVFSIHQSEEAMEYKCFRGIQSDKNISKLQCLPICFPFPINEILCLNMCVGQSAEHNKSEMYLCMRAPVCRIFIRLR